MLTFIIETDWVFYPIMLCLTVMYVALMIVLVVGLYVSVIELIRDFRSPYRRDQRERRRIMRSMIP